MWSRLRLDIPASDLFWAVGATVVPGNRLHVRESLENHWSGGQNDAIACLSVRSAFDLFLQSVDFPIQSEILFSAITIPSMPEIARQHGLVPVPVDVEGIDCRIVVESLHRAITPRTKAIVVAHLFGARPGLSPILKIAQENSLVVIEDCAQAWCDWTWRGDERADINLFSFGTIKTATASGGALCRVRNPDTLARMRQLQNQHPLQHSFEFMMRLWKNVFLIAASQRWVYGTLWTLFQQTRLPFEETMSRMTQGFAANNLLGRIRQQPSIGILRLLQRRLKRYEAERISRRIEHARRMIRQLQLGDTYDSILSEGHSFWLFPLRVTDAPRLIDHLRRHGFDATQRGRLEVVKTPPDRLELECPKAITILARTVLLPCYPELTDLAIDRMCQLIMEFDREERLRPR